MFQTVSLSIIKSFSLYTQQWYKLSRFCWQLASRIRTEPRKLSENLYDIYQCCVYSEKTPDDGQRNCPKHVEFYSKNESEKSVHLVGFIIRIHNAKFTPYMFKMTVSESRTGFWHYGRIGSTLCGRKQSSARLGKSSVRRYIQILNVIDLQVRNIKEWYLYSDTSANEDNSFRNHIR